MTSLIKKPRIYVDVVPEKITALEQYKYQIKVSATPDTEFLEANASVDIEVPYDGYRYFSKEAIRNLKDVYLPAQEKNELSGIIGHLAMQAPLNWETDLSRPIRPTMIPFEIPLQTENLTQEQWDSDEWRVRLTEEHSLADLHFPPIEVEIELYDDIISSRGTTFDTFIQQRLENNQLEGAMVFDFTIRVLLPKMIGLEGISVVLAELELAWPSIAAPWQMNWYSFETRDGTKKFYDKAWQYDTKRESILLENIPAEDQRRDAQSPLASYESTLRMVMMLPGMFVSNDSGAINAVLQGKVKARIENFLLSGSHVAWMRVDGNLSGKDLPKIAHQTEILADFSALLSERFTNRSLVTYRQWVFPGVSLTGVRVSDVAAALMDLGYRVQESSLQNLNGTLNSAKIEVSKYSRMSERNEHARLGMEILLSRSATGTTARKREFKGIVVSTDQPTSDLVVQLRGTMGIAGSLLDHDAAELMSLLSKRFANVTDLR